MEFRAVLRALRSGWWLVALGLVVGTCVAWAVSAVTQPLYTAKTQLFVSTSDSTTASEVFQGSQFSQQRVQSYAALLEGEEIAARVIGRLSLDESPAVLASRIEARVTPDTVLLGVAVTDAAPSQAQRIAAAIGAEFARLVEELETPTTGTASPVKVTVVDHPDLPEQPSSPQTGRNGGFGALLGILLGASVAVIRVRLDRSVRDPADAAALGGAPLIGTIMRDDLLEENHVIIQNGAGRAAEDFRQLRTNLQFLNVDEPPKVIMVSGAVPSEGKTTVVINLALALVDAGRRVTIVEADLRKPKVTRYLGMVGGAGLTNILAGTASVDEVVQAYGSGELKVIASGPTPPNPGELLASSQMFSLVDKLRAENDYVLVDAPPLLPVADSSGLAVIMDGVLLSVRYGSTTRDQLRQAATTLERVGAKTLGVILNIVPPKAALASGYGYGYGYSYEDDGKHAAT
jgi:capsular exopolysaccharide synthesis family protein